MKSIPLRAAATALIAALAAGAVLPGDVAAKPSGKPPISKALPRSYFKKKIYLHCQVIQVGQQRKVRVANALGYTLRPGGKIFWRGTGNRGRVGMTYTLPTSLHTGGHIDFDVRSTITDCRAWILGSIYR